MTNVPLFRTLSCLLCLLVLLLSPVCRADTQAGYNAFAEPQFESVAPNGAIAQGVVSALVQDKAGFVWVGTGSGLLRFDGYNFRNQALDLPGQTTQGIGFIRSLLVGRDGRLWIGTESDGLAVLDPATERITRYSSQPNDKDLAGISPGTIRAMAEDRDGALWIGTIGYGLDRYDPSTGRFEHFRATGDAGALNDQRVQALLVDRRGGLWVGTWQGLSRRPAGASGFESVPALPGLKGKIVSRLFEAADGQIWAGTQQGDLVLIDAVTGRGRLLDSAGGSVYSMAEDGNGQVWVGRSNGVELRRAGDGHLLRHLQYDRFKSSGLASNEVRALLLDRSGWIWVGSYGGGLQRHNPANASIWVRREEAGHGAVFDDPSSRSLLELDNGEIWVGTAERGVAIMDRQLRLVGALQPTPGRGQALGGGRIGGMAQTTDGSVWVGSDAGLYRLDRQHRILQRLQPGQGRVRRLLAGRDGDLWIATQDGLYHYANGNLSRLADSQGRPVTGDINALALSNEQGLWVGSEKGLYLLRPGGDALDPVTSPAGAGLAHSSIVGLLLDSQHRLWVDTAAGLHRLSTWDGRQARFERVSERHGFAGRAFGANLLEDGRGRIWTQLFVYDPLRDTLQELTAADGVDHGTGWFRSYVKLRDGRLLFGGSKGVVVVSPDSFNGWNYAPPLVVSELRIDGRRQSAGLLGRPVDDSEQGPSLQLRPPARNFSLEFAALDYSDPSRSQYAYKLEGFDADWIATRANFRVASYGNLSPGSYLLKVRATNRSGVWSPHELAIPIEVLPAWWQQWWARASALLLMAGLFFGVLQLRVAMVRRRERQLVAMVEDRTRELKELSAAMQEASLSDPLTGLRNRRFLTHHIESDIAITLRRHAGQVQRGGSLMEDADLIFFMIDIDHFKQVNDEYGHAGGDALLMQVRERLQPVFRSTDYIVRWGGEEFLVVARATTRVHATELAERLREKVAAKPFVLDDGRQLYKTCSVGFACFPLAPEQPDLLDWSATVDLADAALYAAKKAGRDRWVGVLGVAQAGPGLRPLPAAEWLGSGELLVLGSQRSTPPR